MDADAPYVPPIARILRVIGLLVVTGGVAGLSITLTELVSALMHAPTALAGNGKAEWAAEISAIARDGIVIGVGLIMMGQAKIIELIGVVNARVKSRFALENIGIPAATPAPTPARAPSMMTPPKERVITIPEEVARQQGVTRRRETE